MNKTQLISVVSEKTGLSKKAADEAVGAMLEAVIKTVAKDEKVQLVGFGTFEIRNRSARQGRDPRTNKPITIPASRVPAFKAGKAFKDAAAKSPKTKKK